MSIADKAIDTGKPSLVIGHDLDGHLADWESATRNGIADMLDSETIRQAPNATRWEVWEDWGLERSEFKKLYAKLLEDGALLRNLKLLEGQYEFLSMCASRGHKNFIITNRFNGVSDKISSYDTYDWVTKKLVGIKIDGVIISEDKGTIPTDIFFDDSVDNIDNLLAGTNCVYPVLIDAPYNQHRQDLNSIRCSNRPSEKMDIILLMEQSLSRFESVFGGIDFDSLQDDPISEDIQQAYHMMEEQGIDPESNAGESIMAEVWERFAHELKKTNNKLRLR